MPSTYTYPGVYVEELPSGVRTIAGVSTSNTAFIDYFPRGPMAVDANNLWYGRAVRVTGMEDFNRTFGGLDARSEASYAIQQYFLNGGQIAWVIRAASGTPVTARLALSGGSPGGGNLTLDAANPGLWGKNLQVGIDHLTRDPANFPGEFNLVVREVRTVGGRPQVVASETHRNLSMGVGAARNVQAVLAEESELLVATSVGTGPPPAPTATGGASVTSDAAIANLDPPPSGQQPVFRPLGDPSNTTAVSNGQPPDGDTIDAALGGLDGIAPEIFNLLCIPRASELEIGAMKTLVSKATKFCRDHRAFLLVDPPKPVDTARELANWRSNLDSIRDPNAAFYFPPVTVTDPLNENRPRPLGPSGTVAGIYARTDATRGVWKAPAGTDARLRGATLASTLTDAQNGQFNPMGINALRTFPIYGNVAWGARTLDGSDQAASEWKYVPVRRTALYIEESLFQGMKWCVFEPNDDRLWSQIRLNAGAFMHDLFRQGAFQGQTAAQAYFVKCDAETTTQTDIDKGIVNVLVGFAPLKPAEFVVIKIQQLAGQIET
jgi:phage tail sheath protein FI